MKSNDTEQSGGEIFGHKLLNVVEAPFKAISSVIGGVGKSIGDLFDGHAKDAPGDFVGGFTSGAKDVVDPVVSAVGPVVSDIPVIGKDLGSNIEAIGKGVDDVADGTAEAANDVGHGQFGKAVGAFTQGTEGAASSIVTSVAHDGSNVVDDIPGLKNTCFGRDVDQASDWLGKTASGAVTQTMQVGAAPAEDAGQMVTDAGEGNWSAVGQDAKNFGKDGAQAVAVAATTIGTGGAGALVDEGALTAAGLSGARVFSGAADDASAGANALRRIYDTGQNVGNATDPNQQQTSDA